MTKILKHEVVSSCHFAPLVTESAYVLRCRWRSRGEMMLEWLSKHAQNAVNVTRTRMALSETDTTSAGDV